MIHLFHKRSRTGTIAPTNLPKLSYGLFAVRDCLTVGASFSMPKKVSAHWQENYGMDKGTAALFAVMLCAAFVDMHLARVYMYLSVMDCVVGQSSQAHHL